MRGLRSFAALVVVLIGLGAYVYFVESEREPAAGEAKEKVFAVEAAQIEEITVSADSGDETTIRKSGENWQIVSPVTAPADEAEVSGLTSNLASLEIQRVIDEQAANLKEYGLEEPRMEVAFKAGGEDRRLLIGLKTPTGSDLYARLDGQSRVFLIPSYLETTFNRGTFDLRDKAALRIDQEAVDSIEIAAAGRTTQLTKADGEWRLTEPIAAPADYSSVNSLLGQLTSAQMKSVEADPKPDLKAYGLATPAVTVRAGSGSSRATLLIGGEAGEGAVYAKDEARPDIFTLDAALVEDLKRDPGEYRQKDLFDARAFNSTRIEATRAGETVAFEKTRTTGADGKEVEQWRQVEPAAKDVDGAKVDALLFSATGARAESFVPDTAKTGLDSPALTLAITFDEGKRQDHVSFARSGDEVFASRRGMPGAAKVDAATLDGILKALDELK